MQFQTLANVPRTDLTPECAQWWDSASFAEKVGALEIGARAMQVGRLVYPQTVVAVSEPTRVTQVPTYKGQAGECHVADILQKHFPGNVENMTKVAKSADLSLWMDLRKFIVEVKNYSNPVPSAGVEKFQRDLSTTNAAGGIFISLNTPITGIKEDFVVRFEYTDNKVVPVAYVCSSVESVIITAVNIITQLVEATDTLVNDIYGRDRVLEHVQDAATSLDVLAKTRNDLQVSIADASSLLNKSTVGLVNAEVSLRRAIDGIKSEVFAPNVIHGGEVETELSRIMDTKGYNAQIRLRVTKIAQAVESITPRRELTISAWKSSARKYIHLNSGIGFNLLQSKVEVFIPVSKMEWADFPYLLTTFRKKISVDEVVTIELDAITVDYIEGVILRLGTQTENQK